MRAFLILTFIAIGVSCQGQTLSRKDITTLADQHLIPGINTLRDFLTIPNYGLNQDHINQNLDWCKREFEQLDFQTETLISEGVKHLFAFREFKKGAPTLLFYLQIDGQPVDTSKWDQESPFLPVLKECQKEGCQEISWDKLDDRWNPAWKVFARSASDSKEPCSNPNAVIKDPEGTQAWAAAVDKCELSEKAQ
ncbi:MAG: hypothetical protein R8G66_25940 [Cytophagales bacterium]|nr:hypothetical protein [Cytophagales bacterium]